MKLVLAFLFAVTTLASAQQLHKGTAPSPAQPRPSEARSQPADMNALWQAELPNMKSDLAELRAMLNVLASQESSADMRSAAALQTNRRMWQVVIGRLAELTQRMDALERDRGTQTPQPHPEKP